MVWLEICFDLFNIFNQLIFVYIITRSSLIYKYSKCNKSIALIDFFNFILFQSKFDVTCLTKGVSAPNKSPIYITE